MINSRGSSLNASLYNFFGRPLFFATGTACIVSVFEVPARCEMTSSVLLTPSLDGCVSVEFREMTLSVLSTPSRVFSSAPEMTPSVLSTPLWCEKGGLRRSIDTLSVLLPFSILKYLAVLFTTLKGPV